MAYVRISFGLIIAAAASLVLLSSFGRQGTHAAAPETVTLARGSVIALVTPEFIQKGKRYAFSWPGGGPPQTFTVKDLRPDGWILVEVAEETVDPVYAPPGALPTRWLNAALATSIQEMRPLLF